MLFESLIQDQPLYIEGERIYRAKELQQMVSISSKPDAGYTDEARKNQVEGIVEFRLILLSTGKVKVLENRRRLPYGLTEQALTAVQNIKFSPGTIDGKPVSTVVLIEYIFSLESDHGTAQVNLIDRPPIVALALPLETPPAWQGRAAGNIPSYSVNKQNDENLLSALLRMPMPEVWLEFAKSEAPSGFAANSETIKVTLSDEAKAVLMEYWQEVIKFDHAEAFLKSKPQQKTERSLAIIRYTRIIVDKLDEMTIDAPDKKRTISRDEAGAIIMFVHQASIDLMAKIKQSQTTESIAANLPRSSSVYERRERLGRAVEVVQIYITADAIDLAC
jgi:hypothetical protein